MSTFLHKKCPLEGLSLFQIDNSELYAFTQSQRYAYKTNKKHV